MGNSDAQPLVPEPGHGQVFLGIGEEPFLDGTTGQLEQVYRLADPALSELALEPLLDELLARAKEILGVDTVAILLLDDETQELVARAAKGLEEEVERGVRIPVGGGFAGRIAAGRRPIYIADVDHAEILNPLLRMKGVFCFVRLRWGGATTAEHAQFKPRSGRLPLSAHRPRLFRDVRDRPGCRRRK